MLRSFFHRLEFLQSLRAGTAIVTFALAQISGQTRVPRVGDLAPPVKVREIIQGTMIERPGRAKVLEFWAASCPPCASVIPHLNTLAKELHGAEIDFIYIDAYEDADTARHFLEMHPMDGVVALDSSPGMADVFAIQASPAVVLISPSGRLTAVAHPLQITSGVLKSLLLDEPIQLSPAPEVQTAALPRRHTYSLGTIGPEDRSLARVVIFPTANTGTMVWSSEQIESAGSDLKSILSCIYDIPPFLVLIPNTIADERYAFQAWVPQDASESLKPLMQSAIRAAASIVVKRQQREVDAWELEGLPGKLVHTDARLPSSQCDNHHAAGNGVNVEVLCRCIEIVTGKSVALPIGVTGRYRWEAHWQTSSEFPLVMKDNLGITLRPVRQVLEVISVEPGRR